MKTSVYIDGFNLYYGALKGTPYRWLDIASLAQKLAPQDQIVQVKYFTARISARQGHSSAPLRQQAYLRAIAMLPNVSIYYGHFLSNNVYMPSVYPPPNFAYVIKTEEKGSDVNLATHLLVDAFDGVYEKALVVSNDSDLCGPIEVVTSKLGLPVGAINPHPKASQALVGVATFHRQLRRGVVASSQLPNTITDSQGLITKPAAW